MINIGTEKWEEKYIKTEYTQWNQKKVMYNGKWRKECQKKMKEEMCTVEINAHTDQCGHN